MQHELLRDASHPRLFAKVALPLPVPRPFTYEVPAALTDDVFVGCRVEVPFGKKVMSGIVTELDDHTDVSRLKEIRSIYETYLPEPLIDISKWIASYYGCTEGEAMQAVLPPSLKRALVRPRETGLVRIVDDAIRTGGEAGEGFKAAQKTLSRAKRQLALLAELVSAGGEAMMPTITGEWGYARPVVDGLVARGLVAIEREKTLASPLEGLEAAVTKLTDAQHAALDRIVASIEADKFDPILLYGVTGSGKTEVYLRAAQAVLARDGGVIVLVPEIGLLPQATARYRRIFGDSVAIIHSRLTGPERFDIWERIERGDYRVVVGPRSAIFSPVKNLGLVIVDEEQDDSYKQDDKPRYHARNVALMRGKHENLTVVLGSATPSAESLRQALDKRYASLRLPERAQGTMLPKIELVDMRAQADQGSFFSATLIDRLERNIEAGNQSIVFLNKRGHARFVQCNACGWVGSCPNCDISLTYHRVDNQLKCHFCGFTRGAVKRCDECKGPRLFFSGVGTQRVELDIATLFPGVGVLRMDADTTTGKEGHQRILEEFSTGNYPILLGTQMVTKGHHFPGVGLVGVLYAEESLNFPDFRSAERTFHTLTQVAGRAGRGDEQGEVIIQTFVPEHYVFRYLIENDYDGFMGEELAIRRELRYPPFARIVLASCSATNEGLLKSITEQWAGAMRSLSNGRNFDVLGPTPPLVARVKNRFREQIMIKGAITQDDKERMLATWEHIVKTHKGASGVDLRWDVDPENFF